MAPPALLTSPPAAPHATTPPTAVLRRHQRHAEELEEAGVLTAAFALESRETATSIRADVVTDGPFVEAKEVVAGFYILVRQGGGVEVRPVAGSFVREPVRG